ncbi:PREDICTED: uncharacterized protein LOC105568606 isoform X2 [Vollenhovia emeryi]|uniref:uncharacterized protein LOC105568606 isoform X2 n=1 Tax=Vollenhovia emeryi TaxID=411798 RepID=UPI0005F54DB8|nr:PREDICTED: uncharacterized protein LOC105568606 isoform X2 [Vollenhovia emeryi]
MITAFFILVVVTAYAAEDIPSYVHVCGRKDPNYDQCMLDNINNVKPLVCSGMPELNVSPIEPVIVDKMVIFDTNNLKLILEDTKMFGICNFDIQSFNMSLDKLHFDLTFVLKHFNMDIVYDIDIRLLVSLANKGIVHITADDVSGKISVQLKEVTKNGKTEIYVSKASTNFDILDTKFTYEFDDSEKDLVQLHQVIRNTISENEREIMSIIKPILEENVSKLVIGVVNNVTYNRFYQLFPDEAP